MVHLSSSQSEESVSESLFKGKIIYAHERETPQATHWLALLIDEE